MSLCLSKLVEKILDVDNIVMILTNCYEVVSALRYTETQELHICPVRFLTTSKHNG